MIVFSFYRRYSVTLCVKSITNAEKGGFHTFRLKANCLRAKIKEKLKWDSPPPKKNASAGASFNYGHVDIFVQAKVAEIKPK